MPAAEPLGLTQAEFTPVVVATLPTRLRCSPDATDEEVDDGESPGVKIPSRPPRPPWLAAYGDPTLPPYPPTPPPPPPPSPPVPDHGTPRTSSRPRSPPLALLAGSVLGRRWAAVLLEADFCRRRRRLPLELRDWDAEPDLAVPAADLPPGPNHSAWPLPPVSGGVAAAAAEEFRVPASGAWWWEGCSAGLLAPPPPPPPLLPMLFARPRPPKPPWSARGGGGGGCQLPALLARGGGVVASSLRRVPDMGVGRSMVVTGPALRTDSSRRSAVRGITTRITKL